MRTVESSFEIVKTGLQMPNLRVRYGHKFGFWTCIKFRHSWAHGFITQRPKYLMSLLNVIYIAFF